VLKEAEREKGIETWKYLTVAVAFQSGRSGVDKFEDVIGDVLIQMPLI